MVKEIFFMKLKMYSPNLHPFGDSIAYCDIFVKEFSPGLYLIIAT